MIRNIIQFIFLCLPYWVMLQLYRYDKSLPTNIVTRSGIKLKAIMVTDQYGILVTAKDYTENRVKYLRHQQDIINELNKSIAQEMNSLNKEARELFFSKED